MAKKCNERKAADRWMERRVRNPVVQANETRRKEAREDAERKKIYRIGDRLDRVRLLNGNCAVKAVTDEGAVFTMRCRGPGGFQIQRQEEWMESENSGGCIGAEVIALLPEEKQDAVEEAEAVLVTSRVGFGYVDRVVRLNVVSLQPCSTCQAKVTGVRAGVKAETERRGLKNSQEQPAGRRTLRGWGKY